MYHYRSSLNFNKLQVLKETGHREGGELLTWHIELQGHLWKWHHYISFGHGPAVLQVCSLAEMGSSSSLIFGRSSSLRLRWAVRAASGFAPGSSVLHVPVIQPSWGKASPRAKANLSCFHSVTFAQDKLISQKEMALGGADLQQIMRKILVIGKGKRCGFTVQSFFFFAHKNKLH